MKKLKSILLSAACLFGMAVLLAGGLAGLAWAFGSPDAGKYTPEEIAQVAAVRQATLDVDSPPRIQVDVDYSQGASAKWFPKSQSPVLEELVASGKLPPVQERTGPEPVVVQGVDGIGVYGGTWIRAANADSDAFNVVSSRLGYPTLVRWSPQGQPIVPHIAKSYSVSDDYRVFTVQLRRGMRWSDGHPYTADDIVYWWQAEATDLDFSSGGPPQIMQVRGQSGTIEKLSDYEVRISFPHPHGLFLAKLATSEGVDLAGRPRHYLEQFHPTRGDKATLAALRAQHGLNNDIAVYNYMRRNTNPDLPALTPWICRSSKPNPPFTFVRNPYYFMVDTAGNQLPYIDRLHFEVMRSEMIDVAAANGQLSMQARHLGYGSYTLLMSERARGKYDVYHWYPGDRSTFVISPNLNRRTDYDKPDQAAEARNRHALLNDVRFRRALSLAINRQDIIQAEFNNQTVVAQVAPGPESTFYQSDCFNAFTRYDVAAANALLDEIGLTRRDSEGFRTFPDGSRMSWVVNFTPGPMATIGPLQFVIDDWQAVGVRCQYKVSNRALFYAEKNAREHDFNVWGGNGEFFPLLEPRFFVPVTTESNYAPGFATWYQRGGLYGSELAKAPGCIEPPADHPLRQAMTLYAKCYDTGDPDKQREIFGEILAIAAENVWTIGICTPPPILAVVKEGMKNVPRRAVASWDFQTPGNAGFETYYFEEPLKTPGAARQTRAALAGTDEQASSAIGNVILGLIAGSAILVMVLASLRHPYILRRVLIMVPTLAIISIVVFIVIQLPEGNYVSQRIQMLDDASDPAAIQQIRMLEDMYYLKDSPPVQYARWMGLAWFTTFEDQDKGLLQGNLGRSMENDKPVNELVGDRILLTFLISLGTILFTWAVAIPTGIYSAVRQYSIGDYVLTFIGFIGMCVPGFLLALIVMYGAKELLGVQVSGLLSAEFAAQPDWDLAKVADLLKHIWVPVVVLGVSGTAGMIRVMRANLLDELKKPYVTTARAKGVRPGKLLMKYPVRLALNPFISGIGGLFPQLVSGAAIVAMVLSLPTVGPLMLSALMNEDMYLAGSMLMVLSLLGVFGTLVSDLLLLWLDPRIRFQGNSR